VRWQVVLDQRDVGQLLVCDELCGRGEHRLVDIGSDHLPVGSDPSTEQAEPAEDTTADIEAAAASRADGLQQPAPAGLPDPGLKL
jgi:hypothetical protein